MTASSAKSIATSAKSSRLRPSEEGSSTNSQIISLRQLKREYKTFEAKRRLATAHDLFLVDDRVLREVHRNLGKEFQAKTKLPLGLDIISGDVAGKIKGMLATSPLVLRGSSTRLGLKLGVLAQKTEDVSDNYIAAVEHIRAKLPGGWSNVRSPYLALPSPGSPSLPVYLDTSDGSNVDMPKPPTPPKAVEGALSTLHDKRRIRIWPDGGVQVLSKKGVELPTKNRKKQKKALKKRGVKKDKGSIGKKTTPKKSSKVKKEAKPKPEVKQE